LAQQQTFVNSTSNFKNCFVQRFVSPVPGSNPFIVKASFGLSQDTDTVEKYAGGAYYTTDFSNPSTIVTGNQITIDYIASCLDLLPDQVTNLSQRGAVSSPGQDDDFFFEFTTMVDTTIVFDTRGPGTFRYSLIGGFSYTATPSNRDQEIWLNGGYDSEFQIGGQWLINANTYDLSIDAYTNLPGIVTTVVTPNLCSLQTIQGAEHIVFRASGVCRVKFDHPGNAMYKAASREVQITVAPPKFTTEEALVTSVRAGGSYSQTFKAPSGYPNGTWSYRVENNGGPDLPVSFGFNGDKLTGTFASTGTYMFKVIATFTPSEVLFATFAAAETPIADLPSVLTQTYTLQVEAPVPTMTPAAGTLTSISAGGTFSQTFVASLEGASGGQWRYALTGQVNFGNYLPSTVTLDPLTGILTGPLNTAGNYVFTVTATYEGLAGNPRANGSAVNANSLPTISQDYSIDVLAPPLSLTIVQQPETLPAGSSVQAIFSATGGIPFAGEEPYSTAVSTCGMSPATSPFTVTDPTLSYNATEQQYTVSFEAAFPVGEYCFTFKVTDDEGASSTEQVNFTVSDTIVIGSYSIDPASGDTFDASVGEEFSQTFTASFDEGNGCNLAAQPVGVITVLCAAALNNSSPVSFTYSVTGLPEEFEIDENGVLSGTPIDPGQYDFTVYAKANTDAQPANPLIAVDEPEYDVKGTYTLHVFKKKRPAGRIRRNR
jgi:hypothetical protein